MPSAPVRITLAIRQVDNDLVAAAREYPGSLAVTHMAVMTGWTSQLKRPGSVLVRYVSEEFDRLTTLQKALEVNRCHAEALLVLNRAGDLQLADNEKVKLQRRALGMLPTEEGERFVEVACCPELGPHFMTSNPGRMVAGMSEVEKELGPATALGYCFLLMAGIRSLADLMKYGTRIEQLFERIVQRPGVRSVLGHLGAVRLARAPHRERAQLFAAVSDALWSERPNRVGMFFVLTQVVDGYLGLRPGGVGDVLGLAVIDSIILGKLLFPVKYLARQDHVYLEVPVSSHGFEYWDPVERGRAKVPMTQCRRIGTSELLLRGYERLARGYAERGQFVNGVRIANWMLGMKPDYGRAYELLGQCLMGDGKPKDALAACEKAIELDRRLVDVFVVQGNAYGALNRWPEAIESYKKAIKEQVGYAVAYNNLGLALVRNGEPERAIGAYRSAARIRPDYAEALYNLGNVYVELNQLDQAIDAFERAVAVAPGFAAAYYNLGQVHYTRKELQQSLAAYEAAVKANPKHAGAWHNMGIVYRDLGQNDKAVEAIEQAVKLNPILLR